MRSRARCWWSDLPDVLPIPTKGEQVPLSELQNCLTKKLELQKLELHVTLAQTIPD
jgi:hypothetical protein